MKLLLLAGSLFLLSSCSTVTYTNATVTPAYYGYSYPSVYAVSNFGYSPWYYRRGVNYWGGNNYYRNFYGGRVYGTRGFNRGFNRGIYRSSYYRSMRFRR